MKAKLPKPNITKEESEALKRLRGRNDIMILPADKGNCTVVMEKEDYNMKIKALLEDGDYAKLRGDQTTKTEKEVKKYLNTIKHSLSESKFWHLNPTNSTPPHIYGLPKIHKPNVPLRPIISCVGSPCHHLAKYLAEVINPLVGKTASYVKNSKDFAESIRGYPIETGDLMVSFDVESLFTNVPTSEALRCLKEKLENNENLPLRTAIPIANILEMVQYCISTTYFQFQGTFYKQTAGMAMGSPLSPVMANIYMEWFEEHAINTAVDKPKMWKRYVDDTFSIWPHGKEKLDIFLKHLNSIAPTINFTMEIEENNSLPFLDTLARRHENTLRTEVYYKKTSTGKYLDFRSNHSLAIKRGIIRCLTTRAENIAEGDDLKKELGNLQKVFVQNNYPLKLIKQCMRKPKEKEKRKEYKYTTTVPYVPGLTEKLSRVCSKYDIRVASSSTTTIGKMTRKVKEPIPKEKWKDVIYKIPCHECAEVYIGETQRPLKARIKEHKTCCARSNMENGVAEHSVSKVHAINFEGVEVLDRESGWHRRKIKEALHMKIHKHTFSQPSATPSLTWLPAIRNGRSQV